MTLLVYAIFSAGIASAQEERPQIMPGERKSAKKKDSGPRAIGMLRMAADGKVSLAPIAILIDGKFWDATAYKADPVPMALDSGTVYEGERTGSSLGLFTVGGALHSNAVNSDTPWIATGEWHAVGTETKAKGNKAESAPLGMDTVDGPPRLTRDTSTAKKAPAANPGDPSSAGSAPASAPPAKSTGPSSGEEPPRLSKGTPPPSDTPAAEKDKPASASTPDSKSTGSKNSNSKDDDGSQVSTSDSGADEGNRPRLRRGKPAQSFADQAVPGYSKPGSTPASSASTGKIIVESIAAKADIDLIPAISDAGGPQPRSYAFEWLKDEEVDRRKQMMDLAKDQLRAYIAAQAKAKITPVPAHAQPVRRAAKPEEPIFEKVQMIAYDLWNSNQPVIIFSAEAHMPLPPVSAPHSETDSALQYSILLVAYPDIYNNLHKLYLGVTDKFHLDITPRLDLIDAVDADGDGRGELLFRKTSDGGSGWIIYRATADKLWKMFDSTQAD